MFSIRPNSNPAPLCIATHCVFFYTCFYPRFPCTGGKGELTLTDLIAGLGDSKAKLGAARKTLERLEKKAAPVAAPLPGPIRERQTRKAGYDAAKEDVEKWMPIVKANREAPTVHFKADTSAVPKTVTTASLVAKHTPETAMEAEVAALLASAGAQSAAAVAEAEEALTLKSLSVAEARERREKLAKMRALLFYHEVKAKRLKKIKSKEYRRRLKKAEKRKAGAAEGDGGFEGLMDEDALRQELEDAEFERAKERLTLKHKNTSRFIRRAIKRGATQVDEGTKEAVAEQLRLGQELRQRVHRIKGAGRSGDSDTDASDTEGSTSGSDSEDAGAGMSSKTRAAALELLEGGSAGADGDVPSKGLFALPFMQRAMDRRRLQAQEEARALLEEGNGTVEHDGATGKSGSGRRAFGGGSEAQRQAERVRRLEAAALASDSEADSDEREDAEAKAERLGRKLRGEDADQLAGDRDADSGANGTVLARAAQHNAVAARDQLFNANGTLRERPSKAHVQGSVVVSVGPAPAKRRQAGNGSGGDGSQPEFDRAKEFAGPRPGYVFKKGSQGVGYYLDAKAPSKQANQTTGKKKPQASKAAAAQRKGDVGSDDEGNMRPAGEAAVAPQGGLSQEDLIRQAFAGDDVAADFAAEKAAEVESELPSEDVPGVMPGWGTWASQQLEPRWAIEAKAKAAAKRAAAAASRKDAGLQYVVVSEKWDKRNAKYRTPTVPFPFDSKDTYERTMRQPLGRDFNTDEAFRNLTRPAVIKDAGVIIQPVRFSKAVAEHSGKAGSGSKRAAVQTVAGGMPKRAKQKS